MGDIRKISLILSLLLIGFIYISTGMAYGSPSIFPYGVTIFDSNKTYDGYTLITPLNGVNNGSAAVGVSYLIDMNGHVVHQWNLPYLPLTHAYLLSNGDLLYNGKLANASNPTPNTYQGHILQELDWDGNVVWEAINDSIHHDFHRMPNGDTLSLIIEPIPPTLNIKVKGGIPGTEKNGSILGDGIIELAPNGTIVREWHGYEHLDFNQYTIAPQDPRSDWTHANTVDYLPSGNPVNGNESILMSLRNTDTVILIDKNNGNISWSWGKGVINHQHDPSILPNGNILIFDNGLYRSSLSYSRVIEVNPRNGSIVWEYRSNHNRGTQFYSSIMGSAQRLPNGNTLICEAMSGRVFEVTNDGIIVWEYVSPYYNTSNPKNINNELYRAYRYGPEDINWPVQLPL